MALAESTLLPAFLNVLAAGISFNEALDAVEPGTATMINNWMATAFDRMHRAGEESRRAGAVEDSRYVGSAPPVDAAARRRALVRLRLIVRATAANPNAATIIVLRNAIKAGVPLDVAVEVLGRAGVPTAVLGAAVAANRAHAADAAGGVRPVILVPEPARDESGPATADADVHDQPATPTPEPAPDAGVSDAVRRSVDSASVVCGGAPLAEPERRVVAGMVSDMDAHLERYRKRERDRAAMHAAHLRWSHMLAHQSLRRTRASRAPRRAAHRIATTPSRDGPPSGDAPPPPLAAGHAPRCVPGAVRSPRGDRAARGSVAPTRKTDAPVLHGRVAWNDLDAEAAVLSAALPAHGGRT